MANPIRGFYINSTNSFDCDKCSTKIEAGDKFAQVKWKKYRRQCIDLVCESCAEGIVKEFESEEKRSDT